MTVHVTIHSMNRRLRSDHRTEHGAKQKPSDGLTSLGEVSNQSWNQGTGGLYFMLLKASVESFCHLTQWFFGASSKRWDDETNLSSACSSDVWVLRKSFSRMVICSREPSPCLFLHCFVSLMPAIWTDLVWRLIYSTSRTWTTLHGFLARFAGLNISIIYHELLALEWHLSHNQAGIPFVELLKHVETRAFRGCPLLQSRMSAVLTHSDSSTGRLRDWRRVRSIQGVPPKFAAFAFSPLQLSDLHLALKFRCHTGFHHSRGLQPSGTQQARVTWSWSERGCDQSKP